MRDNLDRFYTEPKLARAIVSWLIREAIFPENECIDVLEPSSGHGAFVHAVVNANPACQITAVDLDEDARRFVEGPELGAAPLDRGRCHFVRADFLDWARHIATPDYEGEYRLILGNPPYAVPVEGRKTPKPIAAEHVLAALPLLEPVSAESPKGGHAVFLLRQAFAASQDRWDRIFRIRRPQRILNLVQRPSFTDDGQTDKHDYAVFVFGAESATATFFDWLDWDEEEQEQSSDVAMSSLGTGP